MQQRSEQPSIITRVRTQPHLQIVSLFKQAFPKHPASKLDDNLAGRFLGDYAQSATFLIARDARTGEHLGFAVGGLAAQLDEIRRRFIRRRAHRLAGALLAGRLSSRVLFSRVRGGRVVSSGPLAPYQLRFIAVAPHAHGKGIGSQLLLAFEESLPPGAAYHAWTLEGDDGAEAFYVARGFRRAVALGGHVCLWKKRG